MSHHCHALGCELVVPPRLHMCAHHWRMVPRALQRALWAAYVPGQERRKDPTEQYLVAAADCVAAVARAEGRSEPEIGRETALYRRVARRMAQRAAK